MKLKMVFVMTTIMKYNLNAQQKTNKTVSQLYYGSENSVLDLPWIWMSFAAVAIVVLIIVGRNLNHKEF